MKGMTLPNRPLSLRSFLPLLVTGGLLAILLVWIGRLPQRLEAHPESYVPVFLLAFGGYLLAAWWAWRQPENRATLYLILGGAILFRILAVWQPPSLSTDIWRYVWDGHISVQGINPYQYPPSSPHVAAYRTDYWPIINHPTWVTMYPPLSQRIFAVIAFLGGNSPYAYKAVFALFDLGNVALLLALLQRIKLPLQRVLLYAWHPLIIIELSGSGHQDVLGIFFMLLAVLLLRRSETPRDGLLGGLAAGLSMMAKGYLLPALPVFARKRPVLFTLAFGVTVAFLILPYMGHDSQILIGMSKYLQNRLRNAGVFAWTLHLLDPSTPLTHPNPHFLKLTRMLMTGTLGIIVLSLVWRPWRDEADLMRRSATAMGAFFILSHTVYPWYATWLVPSFCFSISAGWVAWSGLVALAYLNPLPGKNDWVPYVEYLPVLALLAWQAAQEWRADRSSNPSPSNKTS
jgi:hypothetical protein